MKKEDEEISIKGVAIVLSIVIIVIWIALRSCNDEEVKEPLTSEEQRIERIEKCFSAWDGSHRNLEKMIKESMNDPNSYEHVETVYWDKDSVIFIRTTFRGRNAFGGMVVQNVTAYVDLDCNVLEVYQL